MEKKEIDKRKSDLKKYGSSSLSYLTLSKDLSSFSGDSWKGYFAYKEFMKSAVILSDPVVQEGKINAAVKDLISFFSKNKKHIAFFLATDRIVEILRTNGFKTFYFGKEAVVDLDKFDISGKKGWSIRSSVNFAKRNNMTVEEYNYKEMRDLNIEKGIKKVSDEWCKTKKEPELDFAFGHVNFDEYKEIRYFICKYECRIVGFITYYPIYGINSYYLDMTRRSMDSPRGVIDFLHVESFNILKKEGVKKIFIGLAPMSFFNSNSNTENNKFPNLLFFFKPLFEIIYPAKSELFYKKKFATDWESNYICFYPRVSIRSLFSLCHAVYNGGLGGLLIYKITHLFRNR